MPELPGDVDNRAPLVQEQRREAMAQVVGPLIGQPDAFERAGPGAARPMFPALHERDERGEPLAVPRGALPTFHSFRHTAASHAVAAGESAEEVSWQLGHRNSVVTRAVYVHELKTAERSARRRQRIEAASAPFLPSAGGRAAE